MAADISSSKGKSLTFEVKPRLLMLLGDQLIRDASLAVFELVKNAYDADATTCSIELISIENPERARIVVQDDGSGMSEDTLRKVWMVIATDFRARQREQLRRSSKFHRFPLGEKGLGRLSVHKLGRTIQLVTRERNGKEFELEFDWDKLESAPTLSSAAVNLRERRPSAFPGKKHGTRLEITKLRETWSRGAVRRLHRAVNSLCSPFESPSDFDVSLVAPQNEEWLSGLFTADRAAVSATYHAKGTFSGSVANFTYDFRVPPGHKKALAPRVESTLDAALQRRDGRSTQPLDLSPHRIGKVEFEFFVFDRDPAVMRAVVDDVKGLKDFLDENGGVRVYRDGIRVYDFGEQGNDWLNLDSRRVNVPTARISNNQMVGVLHLSATESTDLREKSNREGFIDNPAYADFREAVISVLTQVEAEKTKDQRRLRQALTKGSGQSLYTRFYDLRETLKSRGILAEVEPQLRAVERELDAYRDQLLHAAVPGLTIGTMLHGAEKVLEELRLAVHKHASSEHIKELVDQLYRAMRPITALLKNPGTAKTSAASLVKEALFSTQLRLRRHGIQLQNSLEANRKDFPVVGSKQMLVASITNLVDNSIHWLEAKGAKNKRLYIGVETDLEGGPAIIVADNGPGFGTDTPEDLVTPFFSRRTGGMGLGLYIVSEVMRVNQGQLIFPEAADIELPSGMDGAIVALQFKEPG
jgi:signal transduction histidine kinase